MSGFMDGNGRQIGIEVHGVGVRIVMVSTQKPAREQHIEGKGDRQSDQQPVGPGDFLIGPEVSEFAKRGPLVDADLHVAKLLGTILEVLDQNLLCLLGDGVVIHLPIQQKQLGRNGYDVS